MPTGKWLTDQQKRDMYSMYVMGEKVQDIADTYGVKQQTVRRAIRDQRKQREEGQDMASRSKVVAGDKANGRLTSTTDPHRFEGTCIINGRAKSRTFSAKNAHTAEDQWRKWCKNLRDEQAFMDMVERKPKDEGFVPADEPPVNPFDEPKAGDPVEEIRPIQPSKETFPMQLVEPAPIPEIEVRPWREVAEERQKRIEELEAELEGLKAKWGSKDTVIADTELDEPKLGSWLNGNGSFFVVCKGKPIYVISSKQRVYGAYQHMGDALKEVDKLNDIAAFLGSEGAFDVEEVAWK